MLNYNYVVYFEEHFLIKNLAATLALLIVSPPVVMIASTWCWLGSIFPLCIKDPKCIFVLWIFFLLFLLHCSSPSQENISILQIFSSMSFSVFVSSTKHIFLLFFLRFCSHPQTKYYSPFPNDQIFSKLQNYWNIKQNKTKLKICNFWELRWRNRCDEVNVNDGLYLSVLDCTGLYLAVLGCIELINTVLGCIELI